ncbi:MAG: bactofilin family protein [Candidatus Puniceispirillaceae bacterium]
MSKTVFGSGAVFTGHISPADTLEIHGRVQADIIAEKLQLEKGASCSGNLDIGLGVFAGSYRGRMKAKSVWLLASAKVFGQIEYQALQMDRGSALNCHILHNWTENETTPTIGSTDTGEELA